MQLLPWCDVQQATVSCSVSRDSRAVPRRRAVHIAAGHKRPKRGMAVAALAGKAYRPLGASVRTDLAGHHTEGVVAGGAVCQQLQVLQE
jgi:hypothetical protein